MTTQTLRTRKKPVNWHRIGAWAVIAVALVVTIFPFLWMLSTSLNLPDDQYAGVLIPPTLTF